ncbi:ABC transporter permease [candidate division KSB1 bacterium]|nr:ABC transporter permease [candidate division KSB1 bacterium]
MFKNYLKIAARNLLKHKAYSLINVLGLAIGMACCILILLYVQNELSYDRHHQKAERIYRVASDHKFGGNHFQMAVSPAPMAEALVRDFPEVESAARFRGYGSFLVKKEGEQNFKEERVIFADNAIFDIFTIPLLGGDAKGALTAPNTVVISQSTAKKYFGESNPVGQSLLFDNTAVYKITGVFADMPDNGHFHFDFIAALISMDESRNSLWISNNFRTYLLLKAGGQPATLEAKFPEMVRKYAGPQVQEFLGASFEAMVQQGNQIRFYLQPVRDIHLHSDLSVEFEPNSNINYVYIFSAIAFFILLIACINFMNLATARSASRAKEVGIRKVVGSYRRQLVGQFLAESIFLSVIALMLALVLVELILPAFNNLAEKQLQTFYFGNWPLLAALIGITLLVGVVAGSYPAFVLSSFKPVSVLKGAKSAGARSSRLRSALVVFQFAASVILIVGTIIIKNQLHYIQNKNLGFNKEQVIVLHDAYALGEKLEAFKNEAMRNPSMISATVSGYLPVSSNRSDTGFWPEGQRASDNPVSMQIWSADYGYIETMGMEIVAGRNFSETFGADSSAVILNEKAAKMFGFGDPIGKKIFTWGFTPGRGVDRDRIIPYTVIGVVKDFHFASLKENIGALGLRLGRNRGLMSFRFKVENVAALIAFLENKWKEFAPDQPFAYSFLDERFSNMYRAEQKVGEVFSVFAGLAIFTACLGLFGLASFMAEQRTKEVGIRKVLGATAVNVTALLSKDFVKLVLVANLIAWPVAWYAMNRWLQDFAYRVNISWWIFALAGGLALLIALLTVSTQAIKAALANPVQALRYE